MKQVGHGVCCTQQFPCNGEGFKKPPPKCTCTDHPTPIHESLNQKSTLSIFNLPNGKWICGNTNWRGQGNMFWNHLWIPSWRSIIFGQTQHRRTLYYTRGRWPFKKLFYEDDDDGDNESEYHQDEHIFAGEIMTIVFTMNRMIITMEILVGFVGQMITENPGCSFAWSKILDCFPGALNILNQFAGTVQRTFEYKMYYSDQSSYQLFWSGW